MAAITLGRVNHAQAGLAMFRLLKAGARGSGRPDGFNPLKDDQARFGELGSLPLVFATFYHVLPRLPLATSTTIKARRRQSPSAGLGCDQPLWGSGSGQCECAAFRFDQAGSLWGSASRGHAHSQSGRGATFLRWAMPCTSTLLATFNRLWQGPGRDQPCKDDQTASVGSRTLTLIKPDSPCSVCSKPVRGVPAGAGKLNRFNPFKFRQRQTPSIGSTLVATSKRFVGFRQWQGRSNSPRSSSAAFTHCNHAKHVQPSPTSTPRTLATSGASTFAMPARLRLLASIKLAGVPSVEPRPARLPLLALKFAAVNL